MMKPAKPQPQNPDYVMVTEAEAQERERIAELRGRIDVWNEVLGGTYDSDLKRHASQQMAKLQAQLEGDRDAS